MGLPVSMLAAMIVLRVTRLAPFMAELMSPSTMTRMLYCLAVVDTLPPALVKVLLPIGAIHFFTGEPAALAAGDFGTALTLGDAAAAPDLIFLMAARAAFVAAAFLVGVRGGCLLVRRLRGASESSSDGGAT